MTPNEAEQNWFRQNQTAYTQQIHCPETVGLLNVRLLRGILRFGGRANE